MNRFSSLRSTVRQRKYSQENNEKEKCEKAKQNYSFQQSGRSMEAIEADC